MRFQAANLNESWCAVVTHSGRSVVLIGKSQVPSLKFQIPSSKWSYSAYIGS
jgi:hypothetical protein